jgi:hypothetical protein
MIFGCFKYNPKDFQRTVLKSFISGIERHGHTFTVPATTEQKEEFLKRIDVLIIIGLIGIKSQSTLRKIIESGVYIIYIDKGYVRIADKTNKFSKCLYYRIACNDTQPLHYINDLKLPTDRWDRFNLDIKEMKNNKEGKIIFAGSSQKYCDYYSLGDANYYAMEIFNTIKRYSKIKRDLVYRPKPSWANGIPIAGTIYSPGNQHFSNVLNTSYALITHGSNASFEALLEGYPVFSLGDSIVKQLCQVSIENLENPLIPSKKDRLKLFANICYNQYTLDEISNGLCWDFVKDHYRKKPKWKNT